MSLPTRPHLPRKEAFVAMAQQGRLGFVFREILADAETPVSVYAKLGRGPYSFLLESVVGGEKWAAYSFVGVKPRQVVRASAGQVQILKPGPSGTFEVTDSRAVANPVAFVDDMLTQLKPVVPEGLPRFVGGAVGFLGYDAVRCFETLPQTAPDELGLPQMCFAITDTVVVFDNLRGTIKVVAAASLAEAPAKAWDDACDRIDGIIETLARSTEAPPPLDLGGFREDLAKLPQSRSGQANYEQSIGRIHEYIRAGDAFQVVLSQRFEVPRGNVDPFDVYRVLRVTNPSPYMFHLEFPEAQITGASPEALVRLDGRRVEVRPIAGTRPRGKTPAEDLAMESELKADPKECAEHVMLIDLGRNDVGRVSKRGSVKVDEVMVIERYSHVMHIVSNVSGVLEDGQRPSDVIKAAFPAGTLSGAPKIRAMQIIEELEPSRRGIYGGAVGYMSYQGNVDMAIAIRTLVTKGDTIYIQAGAGVVADSVPAAEHAECENKARAVLMAIERARQARKETNERAAGHR